MSQPGPEDVGACLAFDRGAPGRWAVGVEEWQGAEQRLPPPELLRESLRLPELSQPELVRYYTALADRNYGIESGAYPLGSCTMKYNPKVHDVVVSLPGLAETHPLASVEDVQGVLALLWELQQALGEITGLLAVSLAPAAGAQGELAGMLMVKRALQERGDLSTRRRVLVPDSAHGTNPASAAMAGFSVTQITTGPNGSMERAAVEQELDESVAALMVTVPNTLGLWEEGIEEVAALVRNAGAFVYGDGANLNAIVGRVRFGDLGFDVVHLNLHKTFSTPHGGGGPGAGPVCAGEALDAYLPAPVVERTADGTFALARPAKSIGRLQQFQGSIGVLLRAYAYIRSQGLEGLRAVSGNAVLNANYLRVLLHKHYDLPYDRPVLHEVVFSGARQRRQSDVHTYDIAKRMIDYGLHPPTVYFPLIVEEALMIEPTETESAEGVD
ncbi:MAG: aminomethyl-transferring glycine dehydrogenase subunit GcvPB, partial [Dehalococcoidia bacterium]